jgi:hypothetical protein
MKKIIITAIAIISYISSNGQNLNWKSFGEGQQQLINVNLGIDNSTSYGLGYAYKFTTKIPLAANLEFTSPFGKDLFDDLKIKLGGQVAPVSFNNFLLTVKVNAIIRRYETDMVRMINFGSEFTGVFGYYKPKWFVAAEFGFDKAIVTHIKNTPLMKENYPDAVTGWYIPTGGNFIYGIQGGYSFGKTDLTLKLGKTIEQDLESSAMLPFYTQIGINQKF